MEEWDPGHFDSQAIKMNKANTKWRSKKREKESQKVRVRGGLDK
jgi:hypothetical protein